MTNRPTLPTNRPNDVPPRWDGHPVTWEGWQPQLDTTHDYHRTAPEPCEACRSVKKPLVNRGAGRVEAGSVQFLHPPASIEEARARTQGIVSLVLYAHRCQDCGYDRVLDMNTGQWWVLDESDYNDEGSYPR